MLDSRFYPRDRISNYHVSALMEALRAGANLPPPILWRANRVVIDGFHRTTARLKLHGADSLMEVEFRDYPSEQEAFLDAVRLNAGHGLRFTSLDHARSLIVANELKVPVEQVATALSITPERATTLTTTRIAQSPTLTPIAIKRIGGKELAQKVLSVGQYDAMRRASGMNLAFHIGQIRSALEGDLIDLSENTPLVKKLSDLSAFLTETLAPYIEAMAATEEARAA